MCPVEVPGRSRRDALRYGIELPQLVQEGHWEAILVAGEEIIGARTLREFALCHSRPAPTSVQFRVGASRVQVVLAFI